MQLKDKYVAGETGNVENLIRAAEGYDVPDGCTVFPGFCDVHVHLREPGFSYKETILTGTKAAAHGGYTTVCTMPNLNPVPDCPASLKKQLDVIERDAVIKVVPYGSITKNESGEELSDMLSIKNSVVAFSDDGNGVQREEVMLKAMEKAKTLDKIIAAHCEVNSLLKGGYIHDGEYAKMHGHKGISSASEYEEIARDLRFAKITGCKFHVCHVSSKESVDLIRCAKKDGIDVTCETAPHYLLLDDGRLRESGNFKMNPPLRSKEDRLALIDGLLDGTIDMIATDHAPHSAEEKSKGLQGSAFGIVGIETAFSLLYTYLVKEGIITLNKLIDLICNAPRRRFGLEHEGFCVWNLNESFTINPESFLSMGKSTPFAGYPVYGKNLLTVYNGKTVYKG